MWFRRDLRLADNEALVAAARAKSVTPLFVIDPKFFERVCDMRALFRRHQHHERHRATHKNLLT